MIQQARLLHFAFETSAKPFQCERVPEFVHDAAGEFVGQSQFQDFPCEQRLLIERVWDLTRLGEEASGSCYVDLMIGMNNAGPERNGGNVSLPGGAQAENEPQRPGSQVSLIRVRDDGGIEQCS